jgi:hypothetical protein
VHTVVSTPGKDRVAARRGWRAGQSDGSATRTLDEETVPAPVDVRLQHLADLHAQGQLDTQEFSAAKRMVLAAPDPSFPAPSVHRRSPLRWWAALLIAIVLGFIVAVLGAAVTALQRPAGWAVCNDGRFVAGRTVEHSVGATGYNFDAVCVRVDGRAQSVSSIRLLGVLWSEYAIACFVLLVAARGLTRIARRSRRVSDTGLSGSA